MTNRSSFELINTGHSYFFVVGAWLSNFCHEYINSLDTCSKRESVRKRVKVLRKKGDKLEKKWQSGSKKLAITFWWCIVLLRFVLASTNLKSL